MGPKRRETAKCENETEAEGSEHLVECAGPNCVTWVEDWLPKRISKFFLNESFSAVSARQRKLTTELTKIR